MSALEKFMRETRELEAMNGHRGYVEMALRIIERQQEALEDIAHDRGIDARWNIDRAWQALADVEKIAGGGE